MKLMATCRQVVTGHQMLGFTAVWGYWRKAWPVTAVMMQSSTSSRKLVFAPTDRRFGSQARVDTSLQDLQKSNRQLSAALSTVAWPPLVAFRLNEKTYNLPWTSEGPFSATMDELDYFAGFFDGDGCVSSAGSLVVGQSVDGVSVLMRLQFAFGGCISRHSEGKGLKKPALAWKLHGSCARRAARLLAPHSIVKRRQLEICAEPPQAHVGKVEWIFKLGMLKRSESSVSRPCTWAYVAGFFDAEGHIQQQKTSVSLTLVFFAEIPNCSRVFADFPCGRDGHRGADTLCCPSQAANAQIKDLQDI